MCSRQPQQPPCARSFRRRGFSLIELLVTLAIATLVVSAVLVRFEAFDSVVVLKSIAYEIALTLREAQVYAVSATGDTSGVFQSPYGVYFAAATPQDYTFFEDTNGNLTYDGGDSVIEVFTMNERYEISDLCTDSTCGRSTVSVVFERPEFDANITPVADEATIELSLVDDPSTTFQVIVGLTGQISVISP